MKHAECAPRIAGTRQLQDGRVACQIACESLTCPITRTGTDIPMNSTDGTLTAGQERTAQIKAGVVCRRVQEILNQ